MVPLERFIPYSSIPDTAVPEVLPFSRVFWISFILCFPVTISDVYKSIENYEVKCFYLIHVDDRS